MTSHREGLVKCNTNTTTHTTITLLVLVISVSLANLSVTPVRLSSQKWIYGNRWFSNFYLEVITRLFSYRPIYQAWASITARGIAEGICRSKAWYRADMKTAMWYPLYHTYNRTINQRINYFICHNSITEYAESNWGMIDRLLRCLYSNKSKMFVAVHDTWKFQTKLHSLQKRSHWYQPREFPSITDHCQW